MQSVHIYVYMCVCVCVCVCSLFSVDLTIFGQPNRYVYLQRDLWLVVFVTCQRFLGYFTPKSL